MKAVLAVAAFEISYLVVVNLVLNLPVTQTLINKTRPEKFAVSWKSAWSFYPFTVHVRGVSANGQIPSMQWQAATPIASARIAVLPLLWRTANIYNVNVTDVVYHQRPRPRPDNDYLSIRRFFPVIENRIPEKDYASRNKTPESRKKRWKINLNDSRATGIHKIWIYHIQGELDGALEADIAAQTRHGPFSLTNGKFDVTVRSLLINGNSEITKKGSLKGSLSVSPYVPQENKGIKALAFFNLDTSIDMGTNSLAFLNIYMEQFHGMKIGGSGNVNGRLKLEKAKLQPGSALTASARNLKVKLLSHKAAGDGTIRVEVNQASPETADVSIEFQSLKAFPPKSDELLFIGKGLSVNGKGTVAVASDSGQRPEAKSLSLSIPSVVVPDLKTYQRYIPEKIPFTLNGGHGTFHATAAFSGRRLQSKVELVSDNADVEMNGYRFSTNLGMVLQANSTALTSKGIDLAGTAIHLKNAKLTRKKRIDAAPWYASVKVERGNVTLSSPKSGENPDLRQLLQSLKRETFINHPDNGEDAIKLTGSVSDLEWISLFFKNPYNLAIHGSGEMEADLTIDSGLLGKGTKLKVHPNNLHVEVLDYATKGNGDIVMTVEKGGERPDLTIDISIADATLKRLGEKKAMVDKANIFLQATGKNLDWYNPEKSIALRLKIPSARVKDMSVYNQYLPEQSVFQLSGGQADLFADIRFEPESTNGIILLNTKELLSRIEDQEISGKLTAKIKLIDGFPLNMAFDISGSSLTLDEVRVAGSQKNFQEKDWRMQFDLTKGDIVWMKPTRVDAEAVVTMTDTQPLAAVLSNYRKKYRWIDRVLTVEDVVGNAQVSLTQNQILISNAWVESGDIDIGAKGMITESGGDGVIFLRYKKLKGLLKIKDGKRNLDILKAKKKFDAWVVR